MVVTATQAAKRRFAPGGRPLNAAVNRRAAVRMRNYLITSFAHASEMIRSSIDATSPSGGQLLPLLLASSGPVNPRVDGGISMPFGKRLK
jgi:hypothetical protein